MGFSLGSKRWPYPQPYPKTTFEQMFNDEKSPPGGPFSVPGAKLNSDIGCCELMPGYSKTSSRRDSPGD